jgi:hypothetical protein
MKNVYRLLILIGSNVRIDIDIEDKHLAHTVIRSRSRTGRIWLGQFPWQTLELNHST